MPTTTTAEQLAAIAEQLAAIDLAADTPTRDAIAADIAGRTWTLPRGLTFTAHDRPVYVETKTSRDWDTRADVLDRVELTVYGTATRQGYESEGQVVIAQYFRGDRQLRAYWHNMRGRSLADGARATVTDTVRGAVAGMLTAEGWQALADETTRAKRASDIRYRIADAISGVDAALSMLTAETGGA
jgi:hypothetical protein